MPKAETISVAFRFSHELVARLDRHAERMSKDNPGIEFTRADAARVLLTRALDQAEGTKRGKGP